MEGAWTNGIRETSVSKVFYLTLGLSGLETRKITGVISVICLPNKFEVKDSYGKI